ncbi:low temperature requirement protein A [Acidocella sp. MX-AZ02]|uniref:low temperature requirement protein A n=1 Tax=Acidocella sp. MX-AZ02 TaxID=1214225 RepID=UPI00028F1A7C|nr:low temperature requirement protein A [Acidocella sp. MX-AZ02]EKM99566.1 low temperature requirement A [Acidocella sp. MX-AZ02]
MFAASSSLLRRRGAPAPVTQIELFFDLIFVFAVTQISEFLRTHLNSLGAFQGLMLFAAMWWCWVYTSWVTNWIDPERRPVKLLLLGLMGCALLLAASLPEAFAERGLAFAIGLGGLNLGRSMFMLWALRRHDSGNYRNFQRISIWLGIGAGLWLLGGLAEGSARMALWIAALLIDLSGPVNGFYVPGLGRSTTQDWQVDARHMAERCAGFVLIALGESITVIGANFSELHWGAPTYLAALLALLAAFALWWIYFNDAAERTAHAFAHAQDVGKIARAAYTYAHGLLVAAIIVVAAGDAFLLEAPLHAPTMGQGLMLLGGPAAFLLGNGIFRRMLHPRFPPSHLYGLGGLAVLALVSPLAPLWLLGTLVLAVLLAVILISNKLVRTP